MPVITVGQHSGATHETHVEFCVYFAGFFFGFSSVDVGPFVVCVNL